MSRSSKLGAQKSPLTKLSIPESEAAALATDIFDHFCGATSMREILDLYRSICDVIGLRPGRLNEFYPKLKIKIHSWQAQALWKKFDARASHKIYCKANACTTTRILIIGAGPCGLRTAIEAQFLGAKVVVIEKRDKISRNNVLHLWPFVISDLKNLGAKKFYGKFCAGSIDHISIKQLQFILLKVALLLGVEVHEGVCFESVVEPSNGSGWRAKVSPEGHAVSFYEFDVLVGADGKRNTLDGFKHKEFRGKLAIAITANFINNKTEAEAKAEEISGVAFIFNQSFFKELHHKTGIDLENIVYYKDETHYFVMTAKKHSLIEKGVITQDVADPSELLAPINVNTEKLLEYAREAADFSTKFRMPSLEYAVNHYGKPDVAMFDFTSMYAAEASCRVVIRKKFRLLQCLVGDSLLEPFWPTGSGCARGFLSSLDAAYAIKLWASTNTNILSTIGQRESIYRLLAQTTPENLQRDIEAYTLDPATRYPNLNKHLVNFWQVKHLVDTDGSLIFEPVPHSTTSVMTEALEKSPFNKYIEENATLLTWIKTQLENYDFIQEHTELSHCLTKGKVLCSLINRYHPNLIDLNVITEYGPKQCNDFAFGIFEKDLGIPRVMSASDSLNLKNINSETWLNYLEQICNLFRGEVPQVPYLKTDYSELKTKMRKKKIEPDFSVLLQAKARCTRVSPHNDPAPLDATRRNKKRKTNEKCLKTLVPSTCSKEDNKKQQSKRLLQAFLQQKDDSGCGLKQENKSYIHRDQASGFNKRITELENKLFYSERVVKHDKERKTSAAIPKAKRNEQFKDRIKSVEQKMTSVGTVPLDKKPKDLLRAIGKIESSDWNIQEIEKKMKQSKTTEFCTTKTRVPKWSKEQFIARQNKIAKPLSGERISEEKFKMVDETLKSLNKRLKEGSLLEIGERGKNKVASIAGKLAKKADYSNEALNYTQNSTPKVDSNIEQSGFEVCFICKQKVYRAQKIVTEGLTVHDSCLKCFNCQIALRPGHYVFDREDANGVFFCSQHSKLSPRVQVAELNLIKDGTNLARLISDEMRTEESTRLENEEFHNKTECPRGNRLVETKSQNLSSDTSSDVDSNTETSEYTNDTETNEETFPFTNLSEKKFYSSADDSGDGDDFYDTSESLLGGDTDSPTEDEEIKKAREMRRQEVKLLSPPLFLPTDTETEVHTNSGSYSSGAFEVNSATEISTDSEFDHEPTIRETPSIIIDKTHLKKSSKRGVTQQASLQNSNSKENELIYKQKELEFQPLIEIDPSLLNSSRAFANIPSSEQYHNKITGAASVSMNKNFERKMRYLLGEEEISKGVMKSASTTILDTKLRRFHSNISECQQLPCQAPSLNLYNTLLLNDTEVINSIKNDSNVASTESKGSKNDFTVKQVKLNPKYPVSPSYSTDVACSKTDHSQKDLQKVELPNDINIFETTEHIDRLDSKSNSSDTVVDANFFLDRIDNTNVKNTSFCDPNFSNGFDPDKDDENYSETEVDVCGHAHTETELSDWAVDDVVSENLLSFELERIPNKAATRKQKLNENEMSLHSRYCRTLCDQYVSQQVDSSLCEILKVGEIEFMDTGLEINTDISLTPTESKFPSKCHTQFFEEMDTVLDRSNSFVSHTSAPKQPYTLNVSTSKDPLAKNEINYIDQGIYIFRNTNDTIGDFIEKTQYFSPKKENIAYDDLEQQFREACGKTVEQTTVEEKHQSNRNISKVCEPRVPSEHPTDEYLNLAILPDATSTNRYEKVSIFSGGISKVNESTDPQTLQITTIDPLQKKLEKIAEERKKQKDLIYDLVMNRLQSKKHTSTEKKLQNGRRICEANSAQNRFNSCSKRDKNNTPRTKTEGNVLKTKNCLFTPPIFGQVISVNRDNGDNYQKNSVEVLQDLEINSMQREPFVSCKFLGKTMNKMLTSSKSLDEIMTVKKLVVDHDLQQYFNRKFNFRSDSNLVTCRQNEL